MDGSKKEKSKKKLRHTKLVLPQEHEEEPKEAREHQGGGRIQRAQLAVGAKLPPDALPLQEKPTSPQSKEKMPGTSAEQAKTTAKEASEDSADSLPQNAILIPKINQRVLNLRRKKRRKRLLILGLLVFAVFCVWLYLSNSYLYVVMGAQDLVDSIQVALMPGDGFPIEYSVPGYVQSEGMGSGGFASLGEKDLVLFSASGEELRRVQHGFANPGLSAGDRRVCVYSRGGTGYLVESRSEVLLRQTTEDDVLFVEMSDNGNLMVVTSSRYRSDVQIFGNLYHVEPLFSWELVDEKPVDGVFAPNNSDFALGCLSSEGGALGTTVYLLNSGQNEPIATVRADDARLLTMEYLSSNRLLVVYDRYAAVYNAQGEETERYDYAGRNLLTANVGFGRVALVFGSHGRENFDVTLLYDDLRPIFEVVSSGTGQAHVLSAEEGVLLLFGQQVEAFDLNGNLVQTKDFEEKPLGLVQAREPLLLTVSSAISLQDMFEREQAASETA